MFTDFRKKNTLGKLVTMATRKRLFLIYKIENFANTQFWKVTKFQGASLFRCGVLSHLLGMGWKTPSAYRVKEVQKGCSLSTSFIFFWPLMELEFQWSQPGCIFSCLVSSWSTSLFLPCLQSWGLNRDLVQILALSVFVFTFLSH